MLGGVLRGAGWAQEGGLSGARGRGAQTSIIAHSAVVAARRSLRT